MQLNSFGFASDDLALENLDQPQAAATLASTASSSTARPVRNDNSQESKHVAPKPNLTHLDDKGMAHMVDVGQVTSVITPLPYPISRPVLASMFAPGHYVMTAASPRHGVCSTNCISSQDIIYSHACLSVPFDSEDLDSASPLPGVQCRTLDWFVIMA